MNLHIGMIMGKKIQELGKHLDTQGHGKKQESDKNNYRENGLSVSYQELNNFFIKTMHYKSLLFIFYYVLAMPLNPHPAPGTRWISNLYRLLL